MAEEFVSHELRVGIGDTGTVAAMHVGHEIFTVFVEVGLEGDGTACDIGIGLHQHPAVGEHLLTIIQMGEHAEECVASGLLHAQQHVVNAAGGTFERLQRLLDGLFFDGLS